MCSYGLDRKPHNFGSNGNLSIGDHNLPIKLSIKSTKPALPDDVPFLCQLVNHVYQFSRMYWRSISHHNVPVATAT
jgi:hypothetical protein